VRGDEKRVVDAFCAWLEREGWHVEREVEFCDVLAERKGQRLYGEAKGRTAAVGLDVDTLYGQLLRRMPIAEDPQASFAVVVPSEAVQAALRVSPRLRRMLRITVYEVDQGGSVTEVSDEAEDGDG
jgi:hypothetical protein